MVARLRWLRLDILDSVSWAPHEDTLREDRQCQDARMKTGLQAFRHAPPVAQGVCYGRLDVPVQLSSDEAANQIAGHVVVPPVRLWTSPSLRCRAPAARLADRWAIELAVDPRLWELDFGAWEGMSWSHLAGDPEVEAWARDWKHRAPPMGESLNALETRVRSWWSERQDGGSELLVGHAGVIRALHVLLCSISWDEAMAAPVPYLAPILWCDGECTRPPD